MTFAARLEAAGALDAAGRAAIEEEVAREVEASVAFAEAGRDEPIEDLTRFVYAEEA